MNKLLIKIDDIVPDNYLCDVFMIVLYDTIDRRPFKQTLKAIFSK